MRRKRRPKSSTGRQSLKSYGSTCDYKYLASLRSKKLFLRYLLFGYHEGRRVQRVCSDQVRHSAVRRGRACRIFTNTELSPTLLKYVISDGEANQTILDGIRSLRAIQVFNVCITHPNLIASGDAVNVPLGFLVYPPLARVLEYIMELAMIFVGIPALLLESIRRVQSLKLSKVYPGSCALRR